MPRHSHSRLLVAVVGVVLLAVAHCFPPLGDTAHRHIAGATPTRPAAMTTGLDHAEDQAPGHPHHEHRAGCASPRLDSELGLAARRVADSAAPVVSRVENPAPYAVLRLHAPAGACGDIAGSGRSTRIKVCRWRI
ncbi:hypothetical protein ABT218_14095 [Streptomyces sp. NPDC001455]|uniref:hypothetical protein n=1 Tax=unclassified Streptomyces TaxID=2593676 RepID=UPI00332C80D2